MSDSSQARAGPPPPRDGRSPRKSIDAALEIATALILSVTAMVTSWATYQASLWDGVQAANYTQANATHMAATRIATRAGQLQALDVMTFAQWADARASGNRDLAAFYQARFRPEFRPAFERWIAASPFRNPRAPASPFLDPEYRRVSEAKAVAAESEAAKLFAQGERANSISDHFVQGSVVLASALFFGGMCQVFRTPRVRLALIAIAVIACAFGMFRIFTLPALKL